jgi:hypothetical protein
MSDWKYYTPLEQCAAPEDWHDKCPVEGWTGNHWGEVSKPFWGIGGIYRYKIVEVVVPTEVDDEVQLIINWLKRRASSGRAFAGDSRHSLTSRSQVEKEALVSEAIIHGIEKKNYK